MGPEAPLMLRQVKQGGIGKKGRGALKIVQYIIAKNEWLSSFLSDDKSSRDGIYNMYFQIITLYSSHNVSKISQFAT